MSEVDLTSQDSKTVEEVLKLYKTVRYCGVIKEGKVVAGGMRKGVKSLEPASEDGKLMAQLSILIGTDKGWDSYLGRTSYFLIRKEKVSLMLYPVPGLKGILVTAEPSFSTSRMDAIRKKIDEYEGR